MTESVEGGVIRAAFVYRPSWPYYDKNNSISNRYLFFFHALQRNKNLRVSYFPAEQCFDTARLRGKCDVILCTNSDKSTPHLDNVRESGIPVVAHTHDPHLVKPWNLMDFHEKWKIDCYFNFMPESYFHKYFPKDFRYKTITYGIEPGPLKGPAFKDRMADRILLTGALREIGIVRLTAYSVLSPQRKFAWRLYKLRRKCKSLPYVDYSGTVPDPASSSLESVRRSARRTYINGGHTDFATHLAQYRAAIAATRFYPTIKYYESTAAGCLTFMEVTEENDCRYLGFRDGESAVFIGPKNYQKRFEQYLTDPDDPRWEQIAARGRRHTMENLTNDQAAASLVDLIRELA